LSVLFDTILGFDIQTESNAARENPAKIKYAIPPTFSIMGVTSPTTLKHINTKKTEGGDKSAHKFDNHVVDVVMEMPVDRRCNGKISLGITVECIRSLQKVKRATHPIQSEPTSKRN
jgi:hypothetical protein